MKKILTAVLIMLFAISGAVGLYYQRLIPQIHAIPIQTALAYGFAGACLFILSYIIPQKQKGLRIFCRVVGIVNVVGTIALSAIFGIA